MAAKFCRACGAMSSARTCGEPEISSESIKPCMTRFMIVSMTEGARSACTSSVPDSCGAQAEQQNGEPPLSECRRRYCGCRCGHDAERRTNRAVGGDRIGGVGTAVQRAAAGAADAGE